MQLDLAHGCALWQIDGANQGAAAIQAPNLVAQADELAERIFQGEEGA